MQKYEDHQKLIHCLAYRFHHTTGIEANELISCGNLEFMECQKNYNPAKGTKFSTYLYTKLQGLFLEMGRKKETAPKIISIENDYWGKPLSETSPFMNEITPEDNCLFKEIVLGLPEDAKEVVKIVFNTPIDLMKMLPKKQPRGINKTQTQKYLRQQYGWSFSRIQKAFTAIKKGLSF